MKTIVIVVERDVIFSKIAPSKSGDFAIINYFISKGYDTLLIDVNALVATQDINKLVAFRVTQTNYTETINHATLLECLNITNGLTPATNGESLKLQLHVSEVNFNSIKNFILISRVMPQSLTQSFLMQFKKLQAAASFAPQNIEDICLYKDKAIPYLLQNGNLEYIYNAYSKSVKIFKKELKSDFTSLALETKIIKIDDDVDIMKFLPQSKFCIKPFNLFGGIGVKIFWETPTEHEVMTHINLVKRQFLAHGVSSEMFILVQEAVNFAEFGDIRLLFSFGKFLGAFKRFEPRGKIHNTMYGGVIVPVCDGELNFSQLFETKYHLPFAQALRLLENLCHESNFLKNEFVCGFDFLLTKKDDKYVFKLTETNIACPTGFRFLDASCLVTHFGRMPSQKQMLEYFTNNQRIIDVVMDNFIKNM